MSEWYKDAATVEQERVEAERQRIRRERDQLLKATDYIVLPDYPMDDKSEWETYRQELRDITEQEGFPDDVVWPEKPEV